ncbi:cytochrome P450 [Streptomyces sp. NPDC000594]|uniref:cytochrome P450 family protein n=1 Tax=Streptomyces sp. NPDC000594 TaxID=3154261 RepID=UPI003324A1E2
MSTPIPSPYRPNSAGGCPHAANARLRATGNVIDILLAGDVPGKLVLGHDTVKELLSRPDIGKSPQHFTLLREGRIPEGWPLLVFAVTPGMLTADGDDHRRLRSLVSQAFTARRVAELRPRIEEETTVLLDAMERVARDGGGVADLRTHFALPLPLHVICALLGVEREYADRLHGLSGPLLSTSVGPEEAVAAHQEMLSVLGTIAAARRERPGDDLTSALIAAREENGDRLSEAELIGTMMLLIIAGHETTLNLITNAVRALLAHPDQLAAVRSGAASWADVVEETLRWDAPVSYFPFRYPVEDLVLDGTPIARGTPVLAAYSAAGRDPAAYGLDADRFVVTRRSRHLSLGHGAHFCLGAPLARMEAAVALEALFDRFPELEPAVAEAELPRRPTFVGNSVLELPLRLLP